MFAGGLVAFLAVAALVFDVGQNLFDWRTQRDAADAAALAGARYVSNAPSYSGPCPVGLSGNSTVDAACAIAHANGYGIDKGQVDVHIPPLPGRNYAGLPGFLEVDIHTDRPSYFAAVLGVLNQNVDALAVAGNSQSVAPPYSLLALNPDCDPNPSGQIGGNGDVNVGGTVFVNSNCDGALLVNGNGSLTAPECDVVGTAQISGKNASADCPINNASGINDPLASLQPPAKPADPPAKVTVLLWNGGGPVAGAIPTGCPGSTAIEVIGTAFASGASVALPTFNPGDLAVVHAYRNDSVTAPSSPAGWTSVPNATGGANGNSGSVGYRFLQNADSSTGTWTNASAIQVIVLRGAASNPIGASAIGGSNDTTLTTPQLNLWVSNATSWVVAFAGSQATDTNTVDLSGTTTRSGSVGALGLHTGEGATTWPSQNYSSTVNAAGTWTAAVEIKAAVPSTATAGNPIGCTFTGASGYNVYRVHPGVYYGGIHVKGNVRVYMEPGTYWMAGGGLDLSGNGAQLVSDSGGTGFSWPSNLPAPGRGVLIYNTEDTGYCGVLAGACIGPIKANGGSDASCTDATTKWRTPAYPSTNPSLSCAWAHLEPNDSPYKNLLIFVDRALTASIFFNGSTGIIELYGTIYNPAGDVRIDGDAGDTVAAQIMADTFKITGNGGFTVTYDPDALFQLNGVGLVE